MVDLVKLEALYAAATAPTYYICGCPCVAQMLTDEQSADCLGRGLVFTHYVPERCPTHNCPLERPQDDNTW